MLDYARTHSVAQTCRHFGIARATFYRWQTRYDPTRLASLENRPSRPRQRRRIFVSRGLVGAPVGVRPAAEDGVWRVYYCQRHVATIDQRQQAEV